jgi:cation diffusion facilitator family transporter
MAGEHLEHAYIREKKNVALSSVLAAVFLTTFKLVVGIQTNSLGILSEAAHSGLDLIAAALTYLAVRVADRPPDKEHQYGHGKIENVSALLQTILLFITCAWIIWEAIHRLISLETHIEATYWAFTVMAIAIVIDLSRSRALSRIAKKHNSQALEADALHFSSDVWSSLVVIVGLVFVSLGYPIVDAIAAVGVALLVLFVSYRLGRRTIDALMDRVPEGLYERILKAVQNVTGVVEVRSIRLRTSGAKVFVDAVVVIRRTTPFERAHAIVDAVEDAVRALHPSADVVIHPEPYQSKDETISDKIRMIVVGKGLRAPHNLEVHHANGKYHIDFDLEYQQGKSFSEAHEMSSEIENEIRETVPSVETVTIHMEEYQPIEAELVDVTNTESALLEKIQEKVQKYRRDVESSEIRLLKAGNTFNLSLTCLIDRTKTLDEVHRIISEIESMLYKAFPELRRVTIHAEPR